MNENNKERLPRPKPLVKYFEYLSDPRIDRTRQHKLVDILLKRVVFVSVSNRVHQPSATSRSIITAKPTMVAMVTKSIFLSFRCDSGISSSTTTKIIAPAAKHRA